MSKVTLPKEVAEAIENYKNRKNHHWKQHLLGDLSHSLYDDMCPDVETIFDWKRKGSGNFDTLLSALVNGYEVELSPGDKVREYYKTITGTADTATAVHKVKQNTIRDILDLLDIKIPGVNNK